MIRLDLNASPDWLDLGHGVQLRVAPITTSLMNRAREEPILADLPEEASANRRGIALAENGGAKLGHGSGGIVLLRAV